MKCSSLLTDGCARKRLIINDELYCKFLYRVMHVFCLYSVRSYKSQVVCLSKFTPIDWMMQIFQSIFVVLTNMYKYLELIERMQEVECIKKPNYSTYIMKTIHYLPTAVYDTSYIHSYFRLCHNVCIFFSVIEPVKIVPHRHDNNKKK